MSKKSKKPSTKNSPRVEELFTRIKKLSLEDQVMILDELFKSLKEQDAPKQP